MATTHRLTEALHDPSVTLRVRLTLWYCGVLALVLFVLGTAVYATLVFSMTRQIDITLTSAADEIRQATFVGRVLNMRILLSPQLEDRFFISGVYAQIWDADGALQSQTNNLGGHAEPLDELGLSRTQADFRNVRVGGAHLRVYTLPLVAASDGKLLGYIQTATSLYMVDLAQSVMLFVLVGGSVLALVLAAIIGYLSAERALKPLNTITQTALQITRADDLSRRIPVKNTNDEVGRLSLAFNETLERLERLFNAQRRFMADVSHELRTPLTAIRGNVDLLQRMGTADPESLRDIRSETERMTRLVGDLLTLAQADAGNLPLDRRPVDLDSLLLEVCREVQVLARHVQMTVGDMDQARVIGDRDRLKQVILNLVTNALKYTPEGGRVTVGLARVNGWARLTVCDTGVGIPPDELPRIFDRFYRVDKARTRAQGGAGLGLSIAQRIAQMHGGRIEAASEGLDKGTTFSVWLPLAPASDTQPMPAAPATASQTRPVQKKIFQR